jgi:multiple sugar transport system ATP-binding protein
MNFLDGGLGEVDGQVFFSAEGISIRVPREKAAMAKAAESLTLGIRPEDLRVNASGAQSAERGGAPGEAFTGRVVLVERLGGTSHIHFDVEGGNRMMASVLNDRLPGVGETISIHVPPERVHLFAADGRSISNSASLPS